MTRLLKIWLSFLHNMPKHLKKLSEEVVHENPWWQYKHDTYEKPNSETGDYYYGVVPGGSVIILPLTDDNRLVMTLSYRYLQQKQSIEFASGKVEEGQSRTDAAKMELQGETGWLADQFVHIGSFEPSNGVMTNCMHVYIAHVYEQGEQALEDTEEIEVLTRRPDEIEAMIVRGEIWDGTTLAAWALARDHFVKKGLL